MVIKAYTRFQPFKHLKAQMLVTETGELCLRCHTRFPARKTLKYCEEEMGNEENDDETAGNQGFQCVQFDIKIVLL